MQPKFFPTPAARRGWLEKHHGQRQELLVALQRPLPDGHGSVTDPRSNADTGC
jgi:hypothetical protein